MTYQRSMSLISSCLLLFLSLPLVTPFCTRFDQSGATFQHTAASQAQIISSGVVCNNYTSTINAVRPAYGSCQYYPDDDPARSHFPGCNVNTSGSVVANGFNNLTLYLSDLDLTALYTLVGNLSSLAQSNGPYPALNESMRGCLDPERGVQCIAPGQAGYYQYVPLLTCVNGTLSQCEDSGVLNGTPIMVCGVVATTYRTGYVQGAGLRQYPDFVGNFIYTTSEDARRVASNPAANESCTNYYVSGAIIMKVGWSPLALLMCVSFAVGFLII